MKVFKILKWPMVWSLLLISSVSLGQSYRNQAGLNALVAAIDSNNTALSALRSQIDARKMENRTGLNPDDPTVGISYLRPNPRLSNRRLDFEVSQQFEFPTVYGRRRQVANHQNEALEMEYELQRREILDEAIGVWLQWIYHTEYRSLLQLQNDHARQIANAYQRALDAGQTNILERNKARIHAATTQKAVDFNEIERQSAYDQLLRLNGGKPLSQLLINPDVAAVQVNDTGITGFGFPDWKLPADLDSWITEIQGRSLLLSAIEKELDVARTREKLAGAMQLPNFEIGFMREQDIEVDFRGVTFGVSIPLWKHRNLRRHAQLQTTAQESHLFDASQQFELEQRTLFRKAKALKTQLDELGVILADTKGPELMRRALDLGEITLVDYLVEQEMYYALIEQTLQTELEYRLVQAAMWKWLD